LQVELFDPVTPLPVAFAGNLCCRNRMFGWELFNLLQQGHVGELQRHGGVDTGLSKL
jgi:hypothetical protein